MPKATLNGTNIAVLYRRNVMSGRPGNLRTCNLYLKPLRHSAFLTYISGRMARLRTLDITRGRASGRILSAISLVLE